MFTKQHYEKIAKLIKDSLSETKTDFVQDLIGLFACDNSKFNTSRFLKASGVLAQPEKKELSLSASGKNKTVKSPLKLANFKFTP